MTDELLELAIRTIEGLADQQAMRDDWYQGPLDTLRAAREKCGAVIYHGPGHQSRSRCERTGEHYAHRATAQGRELVWHGDEGVTGYFDESPEGEG